jgi:heat shock protein HslJ
MLLEPIAHWRTHVRRLLIGIALVTVGIVAAACSSGGSGGTGGTIEGKNWKLTSYDFSGAATSVPDGIVVDATFAAGKVAGFSGCNIYNAPATVDGAKLTVGKAATTAMACEPTATDLEAAYLGNLSNAATFTATADKLTIYNKTGKLVLTYAAGAANPLEGEWLVTGYNNGKQAVTSPMTGTTLTAVFTPDGKVSGDAGCNTYNGPYKLDGTALTVGPLATTMKACDQAIMDQETQFLTALQTPTNVEPSGATVTLRDASGATQVILGPK